MKNISLNNITLEKANKDRKRVGRGGGSGLGKTAGRGHKRSKVSFRRIYTTRL